MAYQTMKRGLRSFFGTNVFTLKEYLEVVDERLGDVFIGTYVGPAAVLNPRYAYTMDPTPEMFRGLKDTFQRMTDLPSAVQSLQELDLFRQKVSEFGGEMAMDPRTSPSSWWMMFGSSTPKLQYLAMRLVSQCCSSSGCERNWSTFVLLHTNVHNRLSHKKLNKLVYVNYNLCLRLEEVSDPPMREERDFIDQLAHLSFYDENNPVREWMKYDRSNRAPVLDEDDDDGDVPLPSHIILFGSILDLMTEATDING
ncbi:uncharacterized protein LOC120674915 [Panicum virgatum]|uniref:uncharacterized protein LOC120674915 n=1 Tax=Panicum virgatum TaxID=38727 RepID=UPI0019D5B166|nr:uncharacterized protein LOC120674915 [Panicum virgatum]